MRLVERIWEGEGLAENAARAALIPFEGLYRGVMAVRDRLYQDGVLPSVKSPIPVVSVGNLTVGGTGKTPVASWVAQYLADKGAKPAIVLRGYGKDEILVHKHLFPGVIVVADKNRPDAIRRAADEGATVAVLDDGFQHRRARRDADIVIVSADAWTGRVKLLPGGPWREPLNAINRASLAIVTRKAAGLDHAKDVSRAIARIAPRLPQAMVRLRMSELVKAGDIPETRPLSLVAGRNVLAVSGVGDPASFLAQLAQAGAAITPMSFADHHTFSARDVSHIQERATDYDIVICTLKDAVKLRHLWPATGRSLWYVSQSLDVETGAANIDTLLGRFRPAK